MKVCIISVFYMPYISKAFKNLGWEVIEYNPIANKSFLFSGNLSGYLNDLLFVRNYYREIYFKKINTATLHFINKQKFDLVLVYNNSKLLPETLITIRNNLKCPVVCFAADDPSLALPYEKYLESMLGFSHVITFDSTTASRILKYSSPKIINLPGGSDPDFFYPIDDFDERKEKFKSNIAYCSSSNQGSPNGIYRGAILSNLTSFGLKIYGDKGWFKIAKSFPSLKNSIQVGWIPISDLNIIYNSCKIYISIVNPLLISGVQARVFDCACARGFQIAEYKEDTIKWFPNDEIETFKTIPELKEKVKWYLDHPEARREKANTAYKKVIKDYKWIDIIKELLFFVFSK